jgi:hypothetical protein
MFLVAEMISACPLERARTQGLDPAVESITSQVGDRYLGRQEGQALKKSVEGRVAALLASPQRQSACDAMQAAIDEDFRQATLALAAIPGVAADASPKGLVARIAFAEDVTRQCDDVQWRQVHALRDIEVAAGPQLTQAVGRPELDAIKSATQSRSAILLKSPQRTSICRTALRGVDNAFRLLSTTLPPVPGGLSSAH